MTIELLQTKKRVHDLFAVAGLGSDCYSGHKAPYLEELIAPSNCGRTSALARRIEPIQALTCLTAHDGVPGPTKRSPQGRSAAARVESGRTVERGDRMIRHAYSSAMGDRRNSRFG